MAGKTARSARRRIYVHRCTTPLYGIRVTMAVVGDRDALVLADFQKAVGGEAAEAVGLGTWGEPENGLGAQGKTWYGDQQVVIAAACANGGEGRAVWASTVAHECVHAAFYVAHCAGFTARHGENEPFTYLADWLVDEFFQFCERHRIKVVSGRNKGLRKHG